MYQYLIIILYFRYNPRAKFLLALREPVSWLYSAYNFFVLPKTRRNPQEFHEGVLRELDNFNTCSREHGVEYCVINTWQNRNITERRLFEMPYYVFVNEVMKVVPADKLILIRGEDYYSNRADVLRHVFRKLGLEEMSDKWLAKKNHHAFNRNSYEPMFNETKMLLKQFVRPFNMKLAKLLGDDGFLWE